MVATTSRSSFDSNSIRTLVAMVEFDSQNRTVSVCRRNAMQPLSKLQSTNSADALDRHRFEHHSATMINVYIRMSVMKCTSNSSRWWLHRELDTYPKSGQTLLPGTNTRVPYEVKYFAIIIDIPPFMSNRERKCDSWMCFSHITFRITKSEKICFSIWISVNKYNMFSDLLIFISNLIMFQLPL